LSEEAVSEFAEDRMKIAYSKKRIYSRAYERNAQPRDYDADIVKDAFENSMDVDAISMLTPSWPHPQELRHDRRPTLRRKLAGTIRRGCPRVGSVSDDRREPRNYLKPKVPR
jgi:hypothetical protein